MQLADFLEFERREAAALALPQPGEPLLSGPPPVVHQADDEPPGLVGFEIRRAQEKDRALVLALLANVSHHAAARYAWLHCGNPHGQALTWLVIERATGEAVACTSFFPRLMRVQGRQRAGALGGDTYVAPRVRRLGLATAMHRHTRGQLGSCGIDFNFSAPVPHNLAARVKAGCCVVAELQGWLRPLAGDVLYRGPLRWLPTPLGRRLAKELVRGLNRWTRSSTASMQLVPLTTFGPEFEHLFEDTSRSRPISCVRDLAYLAWRYLQAPQHRQQPFAVKRGNTTLGFVALEQQGQRAAVTDLFTVDDGEILAATLQLIREHATRAGCSRLETAGARHSAFAPSLSRHLFIRHGLGRLLQVTVPDLDPQAAVLRNPRAWHFLAADEDLESVFS